MPLLVADVVVSTPILIDIVVTTSDVHLIADRTAIVRDHIPTHRHVPVVALEFNSSSTVVLNVTEANSPGRIPRTDTIEIGRTTVALEINATTSIAGDCVLGNGAIPGVKYADSRSSRPWGSGRRIAVSCDGISKDLNAGNPYVGVV